MPKKKAMAALNSNKNPAIVAFGVKIYQDSSANQA
jgi:hypothetical protein